jgi:hypothetical protein
MLISLFIFCLPKKRTKKGLRKRKIQSFCPPATQCLNDATKKSEFRAVSGFALAPFFIKICKRSLLFGFIRPQIILGLSDRFEACCKGLV